MKLPRLDRLVTRQHFVVHRDQCRSAGASNRQVRYRLESGTWTRVFPDVFFVGKGKPGLEARAMAAHLQCGPRSLVVGRAGLVLRGLAPRHDSGPIEVLAPRRVRVEGISCFVRGDLPSRPRIHVGPVPIATLEEILFYGARSMTRDELASAISEAAHRGLKVQSLLDICDTRGGRGVRGASILRELVHRHLDGLLTESELEEIFLPHLLRRGLRPLTQFQIREGGRVWRRGDFVIADVKVDAETDGYSPHSRRDRFEKDREVDRVLTLRYGWLVPRFTYQQIVDDPSGAAAEVAAAVRARRST